MEVEMLKLESSNSEKDGNVVERERQLVERKGQVEESTMKIFKKCTWETDLDTWKKDVVPTFGPACAAKMRNEESLQKRRSYAGTKG
jgi:hypothetical protein